MVKRLVLLVCCYYMSLLYPPPLLLHFVPPWLHWTSENLQNGTCKGGHNQDWDHSWCLACRLCHRCLVFVFPDQDPVKSSLSAMNFCLHTAFNTNDVHDSSFSPSFIFVKHSFTMRFFLNSRGWFVLFAFAIARDW